MKILLSVMIVFMAACGENRADKTQEPVNDGGLADRGEQLFKTKCAQCHRPDSDFVGHALSGVESRWKDKKLLYDFVRNSAAVIQTDAYAADLFAKWKQAPMLPFPGLTDAETDAIFKYCDNSSMAK